jgi:molybdopterin-guanine dinucleotide biosynthesis protein A
VTAGLILTGGASTRMGRDKATMEIDGVPLAASVARVVASVADPVLVIGPGAGTGLEAIDDPREGPLVALATGRRALLERGIDEAVLVLACDLPRVNAALLSFVIREAEYPGADAVVPVLDGRDQSLCTWYAPRALDAAARLARDGERSMRSLLSSGIAVRRIPQTEWEAVARDARALLDLDSPEDLRSITPD